MIENRDGARSVSPTSLPRGTFKGEEVRRNDPSLLSNPSSPKIGSFSISPKRSYICSVNRCSVARDAVSVSSFTWCETCMGLRALGRVVGFDRDLVGEDERDPVCFLSCRYASIISLSVTGLLGFGKPGNISSSNAFAYFITPDGTKSEPKGRNVLAMYRYEIASGFMFLCDPLRIPIPPERIIPLRRSFSNSRSAGL